MVSQSTERNGYKVGGYMYAKIENGVLRFAPSCLQHNGKTVINPGEEMLLALGYLPVQYNDAPAVDDGYRAELHWERTDTAIVQTWEVVEDTSPTPLDERVDALETTTDDMILLMADLIGGM